MYSFAWILICLSLGDLPLNIKKLTWFEQGFKNGGLANDYTRKIFSSLCNV